MVTGSRVPSTSHEVGQHWDRDSGEGGGRLWGVHAGEDGSGTAVRRSMRSARRRRNWFTSCSMSPARSVLSASKSPWAAVFRRPPIDLGNYPTRAVTHAVEVSARRLRVAERSPPLPGAGPPPRGSHLPGPRLLQCRARGSEAGGGGLDARVSCPGSSRVPPARSAASAQPRSTRSA
jgi:hypothetical protein